MFFGLFESPVDDEGKSVNQEIMELKRRVSDIENYNETCKSEHKDHYQYRRSTDDKLEGTNAVLNEILGILKEFKDAVPTIKRSQAAYTTIDTIKSGCLWIGAVCGVLFAIHTLVNMFA